jgi:hypothetical protein
MQNEKRGGGVTQMVEVLMVLQMRRLRERGPSKDCGTHRLQLMKRILADAGFLEVGYGRLDNILDDFEVDVALLSHVSRVCLRLISLIAGLGSFGTGHHIPPAGSSFCVPGMIRADWRLRRKWVRIIGAVSGYLP